MPFRRVGFDGWLRDRAVGLGNANYEQRIVQALRKKKSESGVSEMVAEHITWALAEQAEKRPG